MAEPLGSPQEPIEEPPYTGEGQGKKGAAKGRAGLREHGRTIVLLVLAVLITLFAVLNLRDVKVDWIFGSSRAPLIVVIVISLLVGIVITYIAERRVRKSRHG
jgi:uncharacterized integral membrane protein